MPQVSGEVRRERAERLRAIGLERVRAFLESQIGGSAQVLVERPNFGRSEHYAPVHLVSDAAPGSVVRTLFFAVDQDRLLGRCV